jgi:sugar lactone lactonase YvrE
MKKILLVLVLLVAAAIVYLLVAPTPVEPVAWSPKPAPSMSDGPYAVNDKLKPLERLAKGGGKGPEGIAVDAEGRVYTGYVDGRVMQFAADGSGARQLADTGGRPLGLVVNPAGGVLVADAHKGLVAIDAQGAVKVLSDSADGLRFGFTDDLSLDSAGNVYFSDASHKFGFGHHMEDIIEHGANGRLLKYDPATGQTTVLMKDLHFPNGVAVGPSDEYLLLNETSEYRVLRYWLKGEKAGTSDVFIDNLPGFPDNITFNGTDRFWVALAAPRDALLDKLAGSVTARKMVARLPPSVQPKPKHHGIALGLDLDGKLIANLQDASPGAFSPVTSVREAGPWLYFGSLTEDSIGRLPLKAAIPDAP